MLAESPGYLSDVRLSPKGDRIAYFVHPYKYDDRGGVAVVDLKGNAKLLSDGYWGLEGIAWSPTGDEVLFSGGSSYSSFVVRGVTLDGKMRVVRDSAGGLTIHDIAADGRWLVTRDDIHRDAFAKGPYSPAEVSVSFLDYTQTIDLTPDGRTLLLTEENGIFGNFYTTCIRKTDGSPVVRLGPGFAAEFSPDGRWALAGIARSPDELVLYPTGAGQPRNLPVGKAGGISSARWFADGRRVLFCGAEPGHAGRCYVDDVSGGEPRAVTPEGTISGIPSKDGKFILAQDTDQRWLRYPIDGGQPSVVTALKTSDNVLRWPQENTLLVRGPNSDLPVRVERLDLATGKRMLVQELATSDLAGAMEVTNMAITDDGKWYAYGVEKQSSTLFLIEPNQAPKL